MYARHVSARLPCSAGSSLRWTAGLLFCALSLLAQSEKQPVFRVDSILVGLDVQVLDQQTGAPVDSLTNEDFVVEENGMRRQIALLLYDHAPLDVVLVIQLNPPLPRTKNAFKVGEELFQVLGDLGLDDRLSVTSFTSRFQVFSTFSKNIRTNKAAVIKAFKARRRSGGWRVLDAIGAATDLFVEPWTPERRRVILLVFDHGEVGSKATSIDVVRAALKKNVLVHGARVAYSERTTTKWIRVGPYRLEQRQAEAVTEHGTPSLSKVVTRLGGEILMGDDGVALLAASLERVRKRYGVYFYAMPKQDPNRTVTVRLAPRAKKKHPDAIVLGERTYSIK